MWLWQRPRRSVEELDASPVIADFGPLSFMEDDVHVQDSRTSRRSYPAHKWSHGSLSCSRTANFAIKASIDPIYHVFRPNRSFALPLDLTGLVSPISCTVTVANMVSTCLPSALPLDLPKAIKLPCGILRGALPRHFVCLTISSCGDVQPYIALALGLIA
jgi:hypothetical protein